MTRRSILTLGITALVLSIGAPIALAGGPDGGGPRGHGGPGGRDRGAFIIKELGLDAKQAEKLKTLREEMRADQKSLHEQIRSKREALRALWLGGNPDRAQVAAATTEINALEGQAALARVDFVFAAKGVLNAEQFKKFVAFQAKHGGRGGHGRGGWGGRHGGGHHGRHGGFEKGGGPGFGPDAPDGPGAPDAPDVDE